MSTLLDRPPTRPRRAPAQGTGLFRAFWRWHLYASFLVAPIVLVLAVTGLVYLLRFQVEPLLHAEQMLVDVPAGATAQLPYSAQERAVEEAYPKATLVSMTEPSERGRSTVFSTTTPDGSTRDVYVDPWDAEVLGSLDPDTTLSGYALRIHANLMAGPWGDHLIELAACWAIVMALTGYFLFFKGRVARTRRRLAKARGSGLRSFHGYAGAFVGLGLLFLLVSGLPWTDFWGAKVQQLATDRGTSMWSLDPGALSKPTSTLDESLPHSHAASVPWGLGKSEVPDSGGDTGRSVANVDTAVDVADQQGLRHPMTVALPGDDRADDRGVYSVIGYAFDAPSDEETVHVDRYGGQVVSTYGFADYPALAKVVAQGIGLHEGRSLGPVSFTGSLLMCLSVIAVSLSGPLMFLRRRRGGSSLGAPRGRMPLATSRVLVAGLVVLGLVLPLFGASLVVVLLLDRFVLRRVPALAGWFGTV